MRLISWDPIIEEIPLRPCWKHWTANKMDLSGILKDFEKSVAGSLGQKAQSDWVITEYVIGMDLKNFDAVEDFVLPAEALNAKPYVAE